MIHAVLVMPQRPNGYAWVEWDPIGNVSQKYHELEQLQNWSADSKFVQTIKKIRAKKQKFGIFDSHSQTGQVENSFCRKMIRKTEKKL